MPPKSTSKKTEKADKKSGSKKASKTTKKGSKATSKKTSKKVKKLKVYCGIEKPIPNGYRIGSMEECLNAGKVNYYGIKKIDSRLVDAKNKKKEEKKTLSQLQVSLAGLIGKESRLRKIISDAKTVEEKEKFKAELEETRKERAKISEKISKLKSD